MGSGAAEATASISAVAPAVAEVGASMAAATDASAALSASVKTAKEAVNAFGETAAQVEARHKAVTASYMAQAAAGGQIAESERSLSERAGQRIEATAEQIAATQAAVAAQDAQMVSTKEFIGAEEVATTVTKTNTAATEVNAAAVKMNSRMAGEAGTLLTELATGQFGRVRRSFAAMMNASGLLGKLFTPMGLAITATVGAVVALTVAATSASREQEALAESIT